MAGLESPDMVPKHREKVQLGTSTTPEPHKGLTIVSTFTSDSCQYPVCKVLLSGKRPFQQLYIPIILQYSQQVAFRNLTFTL